LSARFTNNDAIESLLRRDSVVVLTALATLSLLAWAYIIGLASQMSMGGMDMTGFRMASSAAGMIMKPAFEPWTAGEFLFTAVMWLVMMIGMMTPSAAPVILLYARVGRQAAAQGKPFASAGWFLAGYLTAWTAFSLSATFLQWALDRAALLNSAMATASAVLGGAALIVAGVYQWTPFKDKCLVQCQSPIQFIQRSGGFRRESRGSFAMGVRHGAYCVGCCWALMMLLFVFGVMNVLWIAVLAILVLLEKVVRAGKWIPRISGAGFISAGLWLLLKP
jgi:predicted metal-binding membrane protein